MFHNVLNEENNNGNLRRGRFDVFNEEKDQNGLNRLISNWVIN